MKLYNIDIFCAWLSMAYYFKEELFGWQVGMRSNINFFFLVMRTRTLLLRSFAVFERLASQRDSPKLWLCHSGHQSVLLSKLIKLESFTTLATLKRKISRYSAVIFRILYTIFDCTLKSFTIMPSLAKYAWVKIFGYTKLTKSFQFISLKQLNQCHWYSMVTSKTLEASMPPAHLLISESEFIAEDLLHCRWKIVKGSKEKLAFKGRLAVSRAERK